MGQREGRSAVGEVERQLLSLQPNAPLGDVEILLVQLEADEVAMLLQTGDGRRATADEWVENYPPTSVLAKTNLRIRSSGF